MSEVTAARPTLYGKEWPANTKHAISYLYHTWPVGWEKESERHFQFFETEEELKAAVDDLKDWAQSEDNEIAIRIHAIDKDESDYSSVHYN